MSRPTVVERKVANRGLPGPPRMRVQRPGGERRWLLDLDDWASVHDLARWLFKTGQIPAGVTLRSIQINADYVARRWELAWTEQSGLQAHLSPIGLELLIRSAQGDEFAEDTAARQAAAAHRSDVIRRNNNTFLPSLQMTAAQALVTLPPGAYVAGWPMKPLPLWPVAPEEPFMTDVAWAAPYNQYGTGAFIWRGDTELQIFEMSFNPQFHRDIIWYLRSGHSLHSALRMFDKDTDETFLAWLKAFGMAMTNAPSLAKRPDLELPYVPSARKPIMGEKANLPSVKSKSTFRNVNPEEAAHIALQLTQAPQQIETLKEIFFSGTDSDEAELEATGLAIVRDLQARIRAQPRQPIGQSLKAGAFGELAVKAILKIRGYEVIELQNSSGHGIDLLAVKVKGKGQGLVAYVEVKTSELDRENPLSRAQVNVGEFVPDRLQRIVNREGHYKNVSQAIVDIANLALQETGEGRPIGGIKAVVRGLRDGPVSVQFKRWAVKTPVHVPPAKAVKSKPSARPSVSPVPKRR